LPAPGVSVTVNALIEDPATGALYAGTMAGVFGSADGGASWVSAGEGLGNPNIVCLGLLPPGTLLAGSNGSSVFELVRTAAREPVERAGGTPAPRVLPPRP
jgi:hypothetical protein